MSITHQLEYRAVYNYWKNKKAARSGVPYMNHITEGLKILAEVCDWSQPKTSYTHALNLEVVQRAFCLHGLVQSDTDLVKNYRREYSKCRGTEVMCLAMEYRNIANQFLSTHLEANPTMQVSDIKLSVLPEVNFMLMADKVQNYKDFELYHRGTHPKSALLDQYFQMWLERLNVSAYEYNRLKLLIT